MTPEYNDACPKDHSSGRRLHEICQYHEQIIVKEAIRLHAAPFHRSQSHLGKGPNGDLEGLFLNSSSVVPRVGKNSRIEHGMEKERALVGNSTFASFDLVEEIYPTVTSIDCLEGFWEIGPHNIRAERSKSGHCHRHRHLD